VADEPVSDVVVASSGLAQETEDILDRLVQTVRVQMNMEVAFISRIEGDEFEFRNVAISGSDVDVAAGVVIPLGATHCQLVVESDGPVLLADAATDERSAHLVSTTVVGARSYIGVPVRLADGNLYGTLCCMSSEPSKTLSDRDIRFMSVLADVVASEIEFHERQSIGERNLRRAIESVISSDALTIVFQPIVDLATREVRGWEALSRIHSEPIKTVDAWFADASAAGLGVQLECFAIAAAIQKFDFSSGAYLSLNASPATVVSGELKHIFDEYPSDQIVLEVTEHARVASYPDLLDGLETLKNHGVRLAVDDAGAGYAGLRHILLLHPEIIKLDIVLTRDIDSDPIRRALGSALVAFAHELGAEIIAEGIETQAEYDALLELGIGCGQGFHIARPAPWGQSSVQKEQV
jgi:EAL domain-containing protein (putative c-di-GMP-specific phosphodiesterase class I)